MTSGDWSLCQAAEKCYHFSVSAMISYSITLHPPTCLPLDLSRDRDCCLKHCEHVIKHITELTSSFNIYTFVQQILIWVAVILRCNEIIIKIILFVLFMHLIFYQDPPDLLTSCSMSSLGSVAGLGSLSMVIGMEMLGLAARLGPPLPPSEDPECRTKGQVNHFIVMK